MKIATLFLSIILTQIVFASNCSYFEPNACKSAAEEALRMRLKMINIAPIKLGQPKVFCGALDEADSESILYRYNYTNIKGSKGLNLNGEVEITMLMNECVKASVAILN